MSDLDNIIEAIVGLFIAILLGYVFFIALSALSPLLSAFFIIAVAIIVIGIIIGILRRE
jgi:membrane protein YdbS with pleckstrin-like domain